VQADGSPYVIDRPFDFYLFDFDTGLEEGTLTESVEVCGLDPVRPFDLSDTIYSPFIVSSIEAVDLDFDENGNRCFRFFATQAGSGSNNPEFASDVFLPLFDMTPFTIINVLPILLKLNFVAGLKLGTSCRYAFSWQSLASLTPLSPVS